MGRVFEFVSELFRRKVVRLFCAYIAILWLLVQGFADLFPVLGISDAWLRVFIVAGTAAIPIMALLSWKYDLVPPQLVRDPRDAETGNPMLGWATGRHNSFRAGSVRLRWTPTETETKQRVFSKPVSFGREADNHIELPDERVSRYHAVLWAENGTWRIRDLDSTNGTYVDGKRVDGMATLPHTCELRLHPHGPPVSVQVEKSGDTIISPDITAAR